MTKSLGDPYTDFFDPQQAQLFEQDLAGSFEGIGVEIGIKKDLLTIIVITDRREHGRLDAKPAHADGDVRRVADRGTNRKRLIGNLVGKRHANLEMFPVRMLVYPRLLKNNERIHDDVADADLPGGVSVSWSWVLHQLWSSSDLVEGIESGSRSDLH